MKTLIIATVAFIMVMSGFAFDIITSMSAEMPAPLTVNDTAIGS